MMKFFLYVTLADDAIPVRHIRFLIQGGVFTIARTSLTSVAFIVKEISDLFQILHVSSGGKKLFLIFEIIAEWATLGQGADLDSSACKGGGGGRFSIGGCMGEPYFPLSSAVCNATIPTLPLFQMAESACLLFCYVLHYLLFIKFISYTDWTVAVAQYSKFAY